jgi:hypothetical protein
MVEEPRGAVRLTWDRLGLLPENRLLGAGIPGWRLAAYDLGLSGLPYGAQDDAFSHYGVEACSVLFRGCRPTSRKEERSRA